MKEVERLGDKAIEVKKQIVLEIKEKMEKAQGMVFYYSQFRIVNSNTIKNHFYDLYTYCLN